jgi:competence protein ComEC
MPVLSVCALVGVFIGLWLPVAGTGWLIAVILCVGPALVWFGAGFGGFFLLAAGLASFSSLAYLAAVLPDYCAGRNLLVSGHVAGFVEERADVRTFDFVIGDSSGCIAAGRRVRLSVFDPATDPQPDENWRFIVRLKPPHGTVNPGVFDRQQWLFTRAISATGYVRQGAANRRLGARGASAFGWRASVRGAVERVMDGNELTRFMTGLTVGARDGLHPADWELLRRTGTTHLMAISGLHVGLIAVVCWYVGGTLTVLAGLLNLRRVARWVAPACAGSGAAGYALLAGFTVPTQRALIMVLMFLLLKSELRRRSAQGVLAFALLAVLLVAPVAVLSAGFWMSFLAVALLLGLARLNIPNSAGLAGRAFARIRTFAWAQWVVTLGLAIPTWQIFGGVALLAPLANFIAVPVFTLAIIPGALAALVALPLSGTFATAIFGRVTDVLGLLLSGLGWLSGQPYALLEPGRVSLRALLFAVLAGALLLAPMPLRKLGAGLVLAGLAVVLNVPQSLPALSLHMVDVGQGLAVVVRTPRHTLLYDTGPAWRDGDAGEAILVPYLRGLGVLQVDRLVVSHLDSDHAGGLQSVLQEFPVGDWFASANSSAQATGASLCRSGYRWYWDDVVFEFLHPRVAAGWDDNNASCVLQIAAGEARILLPGDIEADGEMVLLSRPALEHADIVVAPHHGSRTSSTQALVDRLRPAFVIFATGYRNRWNFPAEEVAERWSGTGACLLNLAETGELQFVYLEGQGFESRGQAAASWRRPWAIRRTPAEPCGASVSGFQATINGSGSGL